MTNGQERERLVRFLAGRSPAAFMVTGSRSWRNAREVRSTLELVPRGWVMYHGGAAGLDRMAWSWWRAVHGESAGRLFAPRWQELGRGAGHIRNREMVDAGPEFCLAFRAAGHSPGTDGCVAYAERVIPVFRFR